MADVNVELYGTSSCPYTSELREHLLWERIPFVEYDVEADAAARARLASLTDSRLSVPVLVESGRVRQVGWRGRSCALGTLEARTMP